MPVICMRVIAPGAIALGRDGVNSYTSSMGARVSGGWGCCLSSADPASLICGHLALADCAGASVYDISSCCGRPNAMEDLADPSGEARGCQCCSQGIQYAVLRRIFVAKKQLCPHDYGPFS